MPFRRIAILFCIWFLVVNVFAVVANNRLNLQPDTAYSWINSKDFFQMQTWNPIPHHAGWDSVWYRDIAENGYSFKGEGQLSNIVFFPLYPFLLGLMGQLFGSTLLAGWLLSSLFLLLALWYFSRLVKEFHPEIRPAEPLIFLLIFPTAFFLNLVYTESLFLFLSIASFYYGFRKEFGKATLFGIAASLTRVTGVLLFIPLLWEVFRTSGFKISRNLLKISAIPLGLLGFFTYHYVAFEDFFLFFRVESWWGRAFALNAGHFSLGTPAAVANLGTDIFFLLVGLVCTVALFKKRQFSYALYMLATMGIIVSTGTLMSVGRYILVLFPMYILVASEKNSQFKFAWGLASALLLALNVTLFVNGYWAG